MSSVRAVPEYLGAAAKDLAGIGSTIKASNAMVASPTVAVSAAAGDQVSAAVASFFSGHAQGYRNISAQAENFHAEFVQALSAGANNYASAEAANAAPLQPVEAPTAAAPIASGSSQAPVTAAVAASGVGRVSGTVAASGTRGSKPASGTSSGEAGGSSGTGLNGGTGGLLVRPGGASAPIGSLARSVGGGSGGLLSRLGARGRASGVGRVSAGIGVGVLLTTPGEVSAAANAGRQSGSGATGGRAADLAKFEGQRPH